MRTVVLLVALLSLTAGVRAQDTDAPDGARIATVRVSGFDIDDLSPGLRRDIDALVGEPLDRATLAALASRIEAERPNRIVAVRAPRTSSGEARVLFLVARVPGDEGEPNVNSRYIIERVVLDGVAETDLNQTLRNDLDALVGGRLADARGMIDRLRAEFPGYEVRRRVARGRERGRVVVTFDVRKGEGLRWYHFTPSHSAFIYHQDQGWSGLLDIPIGGGHIRVTPRVALDNGADLVEEYSGAGVRFEARVGPSERWGASLEASRYKTTWRDTTLDFLAGHPDVAQAYDSRATVMPSLSYAFSPRVRATFGLDVTQFDPRDDGQAHQTATAFTTSVAYEQRWIENEAGHAVQASAEFATADSDVGGDYTFKRFEAEGRYRYRWSEHGTVITSFQGGHITGRAPLVDRFTLGDASTLRGWNKYELVPAGGDSMVHGSVEYRYWGASVFVDLGSVWSLSDERRLRIGSGLGYHFDNFFATVGFRLNADAAEPTFMIGVRF